MGKLGPLELGIARSEIEKRVGKADDCGPTQRRRPHENCILLYGDLGKMNVQLFISEGRLVLIALYFRGSDDTTTLPQWLAPQSCPLKASMAMNDFFAYADRQRLKWRLDYSLSFDDQTTLLVAPAGTKLIWGHDPDKLYAAMKS